MATPIKEEPTPNRKPTPIDVDFNLFLCRLAYELETARETYSCASEDRFPPPRYWADLTNPTQDQMQAACDKANNDACCKAAQEWLAQREKDISRLRQRFQEYLFVEEEDKWPKKWMVRDSKIKAMLNKTKFGVVMNYLWTNSTKEMTKNLVEQLPREKTILRTGEKVADLVLVRVDPKGMAAGLRMSSAMAYRYIQRFAELGIIREQGKTPGFWVKAYSIGTWVEFRGGLRRNPFLINTPEWREKLRDFRVDLKGGGVKVGL